MKTSPMDLILVTIK